MSMFHELMMRKKEETMYATIKGSPTQSPYGVFSGFSASNYLEVQDSLDLTKSWEFQITFTTGNDISTEQFILTDTQNPSPIGFGIFTNSQFVAYYMNTQGTRVYTFINGLSANTKYKVNLKYNRDEHKFYVYIDGVQKTANSSIYSLSNRKIRFGVSRIFASAFAGSIDLNNSYIKLGSTKYNLQAVVGYTVVGSPTITDGVVSGFSNSNYLKTNGGFNISNVENFEVVICAKPNSANCLIGAGSGDANSWKILFNSSQLWFVPKTQSASGNLQISATFDTNTFYYIKATKKGDIATISYSTDGVNWQGLKSDTISWGTSILDISIGYLSNYATSFSGSIDLNKTYIKINNKLWFNGQQA